MSRWDNAKYQQIAAELRQAIQEGDYLPGEQLPGVIDGHHRIVAAMRLGMGEVPVADAWDGSGWEVFASDSGMDDAVG